jgi:carbon-monoxide dehydrogenase catalytic subunit
VRLEEWRERPAFKEDKSLATEYEKLSADRATQKMLKRADEGLIKTVFQRWQEQQPQCGFGLLGVCCRNCNMGPCIIDPFKVGPQKGTCGADADTIVARNILRMIAGGTAAHAEHARHVAIVLSEAAQKKVPYYVTDETKLNAVAKTIGIATEGKKKEDIAREVAEAALADFSNMSEEPMRFLTAYMPKRRIETWKKLGILPRNPYKEIAECMHRTHIGVDAEPANILLHGLRTGLSDGVSKLIATELQDILFGTPKLVRSTANLGVLREDMVNIIVHGHVPLLSEKVVDAARSEEMQKLARNVGAEGINVVGMCCTGNEVLMRKGVPLAGNFLQQELAIVTGAVEAMVVDVQCIMPGLADVAACFHTQLITTMPEAKIPGATHIPFVESRADESAKVIVEAGVKRFQARDKTRVYIPDDKVEMMGGFSVETIVGALGGTLEPLIDAVKSGAIRGLAGLVGCNNPKVKHDYGHVKLAENLIKNDVLVVGTGCWAHAAAKAGLMVPEAAAKCGSGLRGVCRALGIPPCLHMGSCVDNSRIYVALAALANAIGVDIPDLPVAGAAMEWMSEKAVAIGTCVVGLGVLTVLGTVPPVLGGPKVTRILTDVAEDLVGGKFVVEPDPDRAAEVILSHIDSKRKALGLKT